MLRNRLVALMIGALSAGFPLVATGDGKPATTKDGGDDKYNPDNRTHISKFMETAVQGNVKLLSRDFPGAIELYRQAIQLQPTNPLGHYLLGEAQSASGNIPEAEASWTQADNLGDKVPEVKTRVLFCLADLKERQKKWDDAKAAWQRYQQYVAAHVDAGVSRRARTHASRPSTRRSSRTKRTRSCASASPRKRPRQASDHGTAR